MIVGGSQYERSHSPGTDEETGSQANYSESPADPIYSTTIRQVQRRRQRQRQQRQEEEEEEEEEEDARVGQKECVVLITNRVMHPRAVMVEAWHTFPYLCSEKWR
jgi:hypothetical protein